MDTIEGMRVFAAVAAEGSFTRGARRSGLSIQTASKYVRLLEQRLKAQLFDRTTRSVTLNDTGRAYLERCLELLDQFDEVEAAVRAEHGVLAGRVRITAPTTFGERILVPTLAELLRLHPDLRIELDLTDRRVAIVEEGYDLAVRIGSLEDSALIARRLAPMRVVVCASEDYLERRGEPSHPNELGEHDCIIDTNFRAERQWPFLIGEDIVRVGVDGPFQANTPEAARQMALAGVGIAMSPMYAVNADVVSGRLRVLFADFEALEFGVYAIYPHRRHLSARVRAVVDHLAMRFRQL